MKDFKGRIISHGSRSEAAGAAWTTVTVCVSGSAGPGVAAAMATRWADVRKTARRREERNKG